jgi:nitrous oxidase accessory protein
MRAVVPALILSVALGGCATRPAAAERCPDWTAPARPEGCDEVSPGEDLQARVSAAGDGAVLCLAPGRYLGPLEVARRVALWGPADAVIASSGTGTTVSISAAGAALRGVTVDGSGGRYDLLDAAVRITADDVVVEGVTITGAVYGILSERARRVRIVGNRVRGSRDPSLGLRGDTIRLWETDDSEVGHNVVDDGRDMVVWYSRRNRVHHNQVRGGRYGTHFMYSHDSHVESNRYLDVTVGVFVMYSRGVELTDNVIANAAGAAGIAIGLKDSGNVRIAGNLLVHDQVGIYLDATPIQKGDRVEIVGNQLRQCRAALVFHASAHGTTVRGNDFAGNELHTRVDGGGDALGVEWEGNYFDDYAGYDLDDDGVGDVPFELRSFAGELVGKRPELAFFSGTPALALADAASHLDPLYQPRLVLVDRTPRMRAVADAAGRGGT